MDLKVFIDVSIQPERFNTLMNYSLKYKILDKYNIQIVDDYNKSDLIIFLVSSRINLANLEEKHKYIFKTKKPIILLERVDSSISWARDLDKIYNLKAVFKNRKLRNIKEQNTNETYYGKYQFFLIHKKFELNELITNNAVDVGITYYPKNKKLKELSKINLKKIMCVLWDYHSSPLCPKHPSLSMDYFRVNPIDYNKTIDVFCVNQTKTNNFVNIPREKAKSIVNSLNPEYKVVTKNLKHDEYEKIFPKCKIAVACWGFGEWVHMDAYAMYAGAILIKPDTDYVKMYPDIYKSGVHYVKCNQDYSDLKEKIIEVLNNYDKYLPMIKKNREDLMKINLKNTSDLFWKKVKEVMNND